MKVDPHVHTFYSGRTTIYPLSLFMSESYSSRLPLICLPLAGALAHLILEERFNQALLFDLAARPAMKFPEAA